jgi:hypothetical protein
MVVREKGQSTGAALSRNAAGILIQLGGLSQMSKLQAPGLLPAHPHGYLCSPQQDRHRKMQRLIVDPQPLIA